MEKIVNVNVNKIFPHPKNPRKQLGDLSELVKSIKAAGILQNLTLVPKPDGKDDEYLALIGNRRHAAAKRAKLEYVPCVVVEMDEKQQLATMLQENIQRDDLTILEQAEGFQMMLDLGETVNTISAMTGFSSNTVRSRVKLMEFDKDKVEKSVSRGATLQDFAELAKIKDEKLRNKVLDSIGTSNFNYEMRRAKDQEEEKAKKAALTKVLDTFATKVSEEKAKDLHRIRWISLYGEIDFEKPEDAGTRKYFYTAGHSVVLYAEPTEEELEVDAEMVAEREARDEKLDQLSQIAARCYNLRYEFINNLTGLKQQIAPITGLLVSSLLSYRYSRFDDEVFVDILGLEYDEEGELPVNSVDNLIESSPERVLLAAAYSNFDDSADSRYHDWRGYYRDDYSLDSLYEKLEKMGYEMSDEERAYKDGTLDLFERDLDESYESAVTMVTEEETEDAILTAEVIGAVETTEVAEMEMEEETVEEELVA